MIPPDHEIYEVERRLALRRTQLARHARDAGNRALQALSSPLALAAAAGLGFLAARRFARREKQPPHPVRRRSDHIKAAKATGIAGLLTTGAMWVIRAQWGSPLRFAQAMLEKLQRRGAAPSPKGDSRPALRQIRP